MKHRHALSPVDRQALEEGRLLELCRRIAWWALPPFAVGLAISIGTGKYPIAWVMGVSTVVHLALIFLLKPRFARWSKAAVILNGQVLVFLICGFLGFRNGPLMMLVLTVGMPFLVYSLKRDRVIIFTLATLPIVFLFLLVFVVDMQVIFMTPEEQENEVPYVNAANVVIFAVFMIAQFYHLLRISNSYMRSLEDASEALVQEAQVKDDFLAHVSHELRTPLNAIKGLSFLMLKQPEQSQTKRVEAIHEAGSQMLGLINDLLDFSKLRSQKITPANTTLELNQWADHLRATFGPQAELKQVRFAVEVEESMHVSTDEGYLNQIANNLISNALKFTREGEVLVALKTYAKGEGQVDLVVRVTDSGIGIPEEDQAQIFEAFDQGGRERSIAFGGTGLGLPIARQIAEGLNGALELKESRPGKTVFECRLPCVVVEQQAVDVAKWDDSDLRFDGKHILVADDNALNRLVMEEYLRLKGVEVHLVENGYEVLDFMNTQQTDLILMDLRMPELDGFETSSKLREQGIEVPIIALSASSFAEISDRLSVHGINDFESKPFAPASMDEKLRTYLQPEN